VALQVRVFLGSGSRQDWEPLLFWKGFTSSSNRKKQQEHPPPIPAESGTFIGLCGFLVLSSNLKGAPLPLPDGATTVATATMP
jgi:hypothetical protein